MLTFSAGAEGASLGCSLSLGDHLGRGRSHWVSLYFWVEHRQTQGFIASAVSIWEHLLGQLVNWGWDGRGFAASAINRPDLLQGPWVWSCGWGSPLLCWTSFLSPLCRVNKLFSLICLSVVCAHWKVQIADLPCIQSRRGKENPRDSPPICSSSPLPSHPPLPVQL